MWESITKDGGPGRVLVVHSQRHVARQIQMSLLRAGHKVVASSSCDDALAQASQGTFDAILIDAAMPPCRCAEALREIRKIPGMAAVPAWIMGAEDVDQDALHQPDLVPLHILSRKGAAVTPEPLPPSPERINSKS